MELVLGTMYFGTRTDEETSFALLDRFFEAGGRVLDTANCYAFWVSDTGHGGQSEALIGRWLEANPGIRDDLVIATKVGVEPLDGGGIEGLSADVIRREVDKSRERLGVETIDVYWAHADDRHVDLAETVAAFGALVKEDAVRRLGASNYATWRVQRARDLAREQGVEPITLLQLTASYVDPRPRVEVPGKDHRFGFVTDETVDYLEHHPEIELWVYSPLVQGSFDRADRPFPDAYEHPGTTARLEVLGEVAARHGVAPSQVVLGWMSRRAKPIVGVSSVEQLDSALGSVDLELTDADLAELDAPR